MKKSLKVNYLDTINKAHGWLQTVDDHLSDEYSKESLLYRIAYFPDYVKTKALLKVVKTITGTPKFIKSLAKPGRLTENHINNIKEFIKAGKESGLEELEISVSDDIKIGGKADLTPTGIPVNLTLNLGSSGTTTIKAKYK